MSHLVDVPSRGGRYLTTPELDDPKCAHLTHDDLGLQSDLVSGFSRTAAEPGAVDSGRGPWILTDEGLDKRIAGPGAATVASGGEGCVFET